MNNKSPTEIALFIFSLVIPLIFYSILSMDNIYEYAVVGAIYELTWFPILACVFLLPFANGYFWVQAKLSFKSLYFYGLLITALNLGLFISKVIL